MNKRQPESLGLQQNQTPSKQKLKNSSSIDSNRKDGSRLKRIQTSPGPGSYHLETIFNRKKGITIAGHNNRQSRTQKKPDPWTYIPDNKFTQARSPRATIGREKKFERLKTIPGPADYNANYRLLLERSRNTFIGTSRKQQNIENKPAPTDYDTIKADESLRRNISILIGRSERPEIGKKDMPGPGEYKIEDDFSLKSKNKVGFTMRSRIRSHTSCQSPDNYFKYNPSKIYVLAQAPAYSIKKQQRKHLANNFSPGPAAYSPTLKMKDGITIPKSQRSFHHTESHTFGYDISSPEAGPAFSIPKAPKEIEQRSHRPGPADYAPELPRSEKYSAIGIGMGDKFSFQSNANGPGPGNYDIPVTSNRSGVKIGTQQRRVFERRLAPGPADYFINYRDVVKYVSERKK